MKRRYEFRFNTVLDEVEYRQRDSVHFYFKPLDKRTRNSIALCALKEGLQVWDRDIDRFLTSDFVPLYNPVEEYLCDLPAGTVLTASAHLPGSFLAAIRIGKSSFTVGF